MDGQRTPLQDLETLYIGGAEPAVLRRVRVGQCRRLKFLRRVPRRFGSFDKRDAGNGAKSGLCATFEGI
jgi:hypothetical protein